MSNKNATIDQLGELHCTIAQAYLEEIAGYKERGEPIPASVLAAAARFLKDNHIDQPRVEGNAIDLLAEEMPDNFGYVVQ